MSRRYEFLLETYDTERLKTIGVWAQVPSEHLRFRPEPRARSPLEHMVHQCVSEDNWMRNMLGIAISRPALPAQESVAGFIAHYEASTLERLATLESKPDEWFEAATAFFDVERTRAWVLTRRIAHTAHHRGQLTVYLRLWGQPLYSTYGPTADTGGLAVNGARVIYYNDHPEPLPLKSEKSLTERPD
ncbi:MAG TPA: DinB family protein [Vicinamibacterales bacterium]|nr:DinB family protein [Vicinamibacterales bacterium]